MSNFQLTFSLHFCLLASVLPLPNLSTFFSLFSLADLPQHTFFSTQLLSYSVTSKTFFFPFHLYCREKTLSLTFPTKTEKARKWEYCVETTEDQGWLWKICARSILVLCEKGGRHVHIGKNHCQGHTVPGNGMERAPLGIVKANGCWEKGLRTDKCKKVRQNLLLPSSSPCAKSLRAGGLQCRWGLCVDAAHTPGWGQLHPSIAQLENLPFWEQLPASPGTVRHK